MIQPMIAPPSMYLQVLGSLPLGAGVQCGHVEAAANINHPIRQGGRGKGTASIIQVKGKGEIETWLLHGEARRAALSA
jgi:hypothetical protein